MVAALSKSRISRADISIFHNFVPPPSGGGHQFLRALWNEFIRRDLKVENNLLSPTTRACLVNSFNFDYEVLKRLRRNNCYTVHRVDGPITVYRGKDDGTDQRIWVMNQELSDATIFQSRYSLDKHLELGMEFKNPHVILNCADPQIFHPTGRINFDTDRKIRIISTSWSDNPNKGISVYQWLDDHLDWKRFEYTFIGRPQIEFKNIKYIKPLPSNFIASILREHDIYITASRFESCSNSLIEALSCGLPVIYHNSGGNPEIVQSAGYGFKEKTEIPALIERVVNEYEFLQSQIKLSSISEVAIQYLGVMGISLHKS